MAASSPYLRTQTENIIPHIAKPKPLSILLIDDDRSMAGVVAGSLQSAGYTLYPASTGKEALQTFQLARPDLILLELGLPDMDGKQVLGRLRAWTSMPIIVMSARQEESEKVACLDNGADDYITRPFTMGELLARLRAALRRAFGIPRSEIFAAGCLTVDFDRRSVFVGARQAILTATEYELLKALVSHAGLVRTHYQLIHEIWGTAQYSDALHLLRVTMCNLRRKLMLGSPSFRPIVTQPGIGYRLRVDSGWSGPGRSEPGEAL